MHRCLLLVALVSSAAFGQAPVEDRRPRGDGYLDSQQRVDFARRSVEQSERRVREAELSLKEAEASFSAVQSQYEQSKAHAEKARKDLAQARAKAAESRKTYDSESAEFERLRRGGK